MTAVFPVQVTVISQRGKCSAGHKVGETWLVKEKKMLSGVCISAISSLATYLRVLRNGGEFHWAEDKDVVQVACPDPKNPVVFELRRLR